MKHVPILLHEVRTRFGLATLILSFAVLATSGHLIAQDSYLSATGYPAFMAAQPVQSGIVNIANGNLHIEIPIAMFPQRGKVPPIQPRIVYDSRVWEIMNNGTTQQWTMVPSLGWRFVDFPWGRVSYSQTYTTCSGGGYYTYNNFTWTQPSGTQLHFPITTIQNSSGACGPASVATGDGFADDSSGYHMYVTNFTTGDVYASDGTHYANVDPITGYGYPAVIDADGNVTFQNVWSPEDTLGRTPDQWPINPGDPYQVLTSSGQYSSYSWGATTTINVSTNFQQSGVTEYSGQAWPNSSLMLPGGLTYQFGYDSYGELNSITLPSGAVLTINYRNFQDAQGNVNRWAYSFSNGSGTWTYSPQVLSTCAPNTTGCQQQVTVTKPSGDTLVYTFTLNGAPWTTMIQSYSAAGALLGTTTNNYDFSNSCPEPGCVGAAYVRLLRTTNTIPSVGGNIAKKVEFVYDNIQYGNVTATRQWEYYSGAPPTSPDREIDTSYITNSQYIAKNLIALPASKTVKNSSGTVIAQTNFTYDSTPLTSVTGIVEHDDADFGSTNTVRGHATVVGVWTGSTYLNTTLTYDTTGQAVQETDPKGNSISIGYADRFYSDNGATPPASTTPPLGPTNAYATSLTMPIIGSAAFGYYLGSGKQALISDQNNATAYFHFNDLFDRPTTQIGASGGWDLLAYTGAAQIDGYTGITDTTPSTSCTGCRHDQELLDGLGRVRQTLLVSDPDGQTAVDTSFDSSGRQATQSNPHRSTAAATDGTTSFSYDGLDRMTRLTRPDGNAVTYAYGAALSSAVQTCPAATFGLGFPSLVTDETGRQRQNWSDGFSRIIEVDEPNASGALNVASCYQYNALDKLTLAQQRGGTTDSTQWRTRTYTYDALGRVTQEVTPEDSPNGRRYNYSDTSPCSGNPQLPCTRTDARSVVTTYSYDALNRLTQKTYSDGTPTATYYYDQTSYNGLTIANGKGRRTGMSDGSGSTAWSYDAAGHVLIRQQTIGAITKTISYSYNRDGSVASITYPSGRIVSYSYSTAQLPTSVTDGTTNFFSGAHYAPPGLLSTAINGAVPGWNAITLSNSFNSRLLPTRLQATSPVPATLFDLSYSYVQGTGQNNSDVTQIANNRDATRTISYGYDQLNRISSAQTTVWGDAFGYDPWGNLLSKTVTLGTAESLSVSVNSKNQVSTSGFQYDAAGNLTWDGVNAMRYDAEDRATPSASTYTYDGDDRRVQKPDGTTYWMDDKRLPLSVGTNTGSLSRDYIYVNKTRIAFVGITSGNPYYFLSDHLGSARVVASGDGKSIMWDADYYPFGGRILYTNNLTNYYQFTGYEFDYSTGYYNADYREMSPNIGRFMSPDPVEGDPANPQSLNRYTYAQNNPVNAIDPQGLCTVWATKADDQGNIQTVCADPLPEDGGDGGGGGGGAVNLPGGCYDIYVDSMYIGNSCDGGATGGGGNDGGGGGNGGGSAPAPAPTKTTNTNTTNTQNKGVFTCASEAAGKASLANALHHIPGLKSGVGGFLADAVGGNTFSGATDLVQSIATGEGGGHNVFYNMGQGVMAGPTLGFGAALGKSIEGTPWASGPVDAATGALLGEYATGFGEIKLGYDFLTWAGSLAGCSTGIIQ